MYRIGCSLLLVFVIAGCRATDPPQPGGGPVITLALVNGRVWTGDPAQPGPKRSPSPAIGSSRSARTRRDPRARRRAPRSSISAAGSSSPASSTRTCTSSTAGSAWPRCSCATRGRARSSSRASRHLRRRCRAGTWITGGDWDHTLWGGELPRARLDRRGHARPSGVGQPARRPHGAGEPRRAASRRRHARRPRTSPAARSCATRAASRPACSRTTRWGWSSAQVPAADRRAAATARSTPRWSTWRRRA